MAKSVRDAIQCQSCKQVVTGYEHRVCFSFVDKERILNGDYAALSCGCEVMDYTLEGDYTVSHNPTKLVDNLRKITVLNFNDSGPNCETWEETDEGEVW